MSILQIRGSMHAYHKAVSARRSRFHSRRRLWCITDANALFRFTDVSVSVSVFWNSFVSHLHSLRPLELCLLCRASRALHSTF